MSEHGAAINNCPVEVEVKKDGAVLNITSFTVVPNQGPEGQCTAYISKLNQMSNAGYYACSFDGKSALIKYVQRLVIYSSQTNDAIKQAVGEGIIHIHAAVALLTGGEK